MAGGPTTQQDYLRAIVGAQRPAATPPAPHVLHLAPLARPRPLRHYQYANPSLATLVVGGQHLRLSTPGIDCGESHRMY
jgi:hypothetical protein